MKKTLVMLICFPFFVFGQILPQGINYQAVARDVSGNVLIDENLTIKFSIISDLATSTISWQEIHSLSTNDYGLFTAIIGQGVATNVGFSSTFDDIKWGNSNHLLKVEIDYGSGFLDMGTTAFMSVPYTMFAQNANPVDELQSLSISEDTLFISNGNYVVLPSSYPIQGCTDSTACNFNLSANLNDYSCDYSFGCMDSLACNYNPLALCDDGSCFGLLGCMDTNACNYNSAAHCNDNSCNYAFGCTDSLACNYNPFALCDDGLCLTNYGCTDTLFCNYDINATCSDSSCLGLLGCTDTTAFNYNSYAMCDNGSCIAVILGCTDTVALNYDTSANTDDGSCVAVVFGCTDSTAFNYDYSANTDDGSCVVVAFGCTDSTATNYDPAANSDDGSCVAVVLGCTDTIALNYDASATVDDGSCIAIAYGCIDSLALNFDSLANTDDGSCVSQIGDFYQGGIIFYLDGNGGGLIAAPSDQSNGVNWGCYGISISGADALAVGTGAQNTIDIEIGCTDAGIAADICANLVLAGYSDWFLPSKDELAWMKHNIGPTNSLGLGNIGGFSYDYYYSSSESTASAAWMLGFSPSGTWVNNSWKSHLRSVRAIRGFGSMENIFGCTDSNATNYDPAANIDDGSCFGM